MFSYHRSFRQSGIYGGGEDKEVEYIRRAYFAGPIGRFPNLNDRPFEIKSQKLIDRNHGNAFLSVNRCLTAQLPYIIKGKKKEKSYNMRRINQLCIDMENLYCEPYFLYDYDFISSYLHFYKIRELRTSQWFHEELRFLLTQLDVCSYILDDYPENFAFEMSSCLSRFVHQLPKLTYDLLQQCLQHGKLCLLENQTRPIDTIKSKYIVGSVVDIAIDSECNYLFLLLENKILAFYFLEYFLAGRVVEYSLPSDGFISMKCNRNYVCAYSMKSLRVFQCDQTRKCVLERDVDQLIQVDFLANHVLLLCANEKKSIESWNCRTQELLDQYVCDHSSICQCEVFRSAESVIIKVILQSNVTHYLSFKMSETDEKITGCFKPINSLTKSLGTASILLNSETDVYYSKGESSVQMCHFHRSMDECFERIDHLPVIQGALSSCSRSNAETVLTWLTADSIVILHSCGNYFFIPGQYHVLVCKTSRQIDDNSICCLNHDTSQVRIFQWKCEENLHSYRQLVSIQVDGNISHCVYHKGKCTFSDRTGHLMI